MRAREGVRLCVSELSVAVLMQTQKQAAAEKS